jgi:serine/threonine protein kinase
MLIELRGVPSWVYLAEALRSTLADIPEAQRLLVSPEMPTKTLLGEGFNVFKVVRTGGIGEVNLGWFDGMPDGIKLPLALKSIAPRFSANPKARRAFNRESALWALAGVVPGILPFFGTLENDGRLFLIMPGVLVGPDGETTLRDLLDAGPLPLERAIFFARYIASALSGVGEVIHGLIHGDLKPENILIMGGAPFVSDFGIARIARQTLGDDALVGTPEYRSPQADNPKTPLSITDDIYSFGVILEEMVTGERTRNATRTQSARPAASTSSPESDEELAPFTLPIKAQLLALAGACREQAPSLRPADFKAICVELDRIAPSARWPAPASAMLGLLITDILKKYEILSWRNAAVQLCHQHEFEVVLDVVTGPKLSDIELLRLRGMALAGVGRFREAVKCFYGVVGRLDADGLLRWRKNRSFADRLPIWIISFDIAVTFAAMGRYRRAAWLLRTLASTPIQSQLNVKALHHLADLSIRIGRARRAERLLMQAIRADPACADAWHDLGRVHHILGRYRLALDAFQRAAEVEPLEPNHHTFLGLYMTVTLGRLREGMDALNQAIANGSLDPNVFALALYCARSLTYAGEGTNDERVRIKDLIQRHFTTAFQLAIDGQSWHLVLHLGNRQYPSLEETSGAFSAALRAAIWYVKVHAERLLPRHRDAVFRQPFRYSVLGDAYWLGTGEWVSRFNPTENLHEFFAQTKLPLPAGFRMDKDARGRCRR